MSIFDQFPKPPCAQTLGWELIGADEGSGTVRIAFDGSASFCNPGGNIQGGFIAAMLDDTQIVIVSRIPDLEVRARG